MRRLAPVIVVWALAAGAAQAQILTGKIIGTVKDESGAVLPGVTLTLSSPVLPAGLLTLVTDAQGEYRFTELAPGGYSLTAMLSGFSTYKEEGLVVLVSGTVERNVMLKVGTVAETITVSGESPMVDPRKIGVTANLDERAVDTLPMHRYYATEMAKWAPGVSSTDPGGIGGSVSIMGSATNELSVLYDGVNQLNPSSGGNWGNGSLDAIEEVQIVTLGASAEYQVAQGGVVNVVWKQGTNVWKFDGSGYWYPDGLVSKPIMVDCNCSLGKTGFTNVMWRNFSGSVGGPIKKDRLWFYGSANYDAKIQTPPGVDPRLPSKWGRSHASFVKATWQITDRLKFKQNQQLDPWGGQVRATIQQPFETQAPGRGMGRTFASEVNYTISSNTLVTARNTGFIDPGYTSYPLSGDKITPYHVDQLTGIACCGAQNFGTDDLYRWGQAVKLNRYIQGARAEQDLRFGVQFEEASSASFRALPGGVNYSDVGGRPDQATFRAPYVSGAKYHSQGVWAEDQVTFGARLTLSLGVRFDRMHATSPDLPAANNLAEKTGQTIKGLGDMFTWTVWSPRLGFNQKLTDDGKTVLRGHYGRAYRPIFLGEFSIVHPGLSPITLVRFNPATGGYTTLVSVTDPTANVAIDPNLEAPFTNSSSIGLDHELMKNLGVSVTYVHKHGEKQVGWKDIGGVYGTQTVVLPDGRTVTVDPLLNATSARRFLRTNGPGTFNRYNGLLFSLDRRWAQRWQANVAYTYSKAEGLTTTQQDPNGNINGTGRLSIERPHLFSARAGYEIPSIAVLATGSFLHSQGNPYAPQALIQLPQGRLSVNIAPPDGTYRLPSLDLLEFRFSKILFRHGDRKLELATELMNVLQDRGYNSVVTQNFFSATFGQSAGTWIDPRRMDLLVRFNF